MATLDFSACGIRLAYLFLQLTDLDRAMIMPSAALTPHSEKFTLERSQSLILLKRPHECGKWGLRSTA